LKQRFLVRNLEDDAVSGWELIYVYVGDRELSGVGFASSHGGHGLAFKCDLPFVNDGNACDEHSNENVTALQ
jgi:hypothetical protein